MDWCARCVRPPNICVYTEIEIVGSGYLVMMVQINGI